jgi:hypothetical protein
MLLVFIGVQSRPDIHYGRATGMLSHDRDPLRMCHRIFPHPETPRDLHTVLRFILPSAEFAFRTSHQELSRRDPAHADLAAFHQIEFPLFAELRKRQTGRGKKR